MRLLFFGFLHPQGWLVFVGDTFEHPTLQMHQHPSSTLVSVALSDLITVHLVLVAVNNHREELAWLPRRHVSPSGESMPEELVLSILGLAGTQGR